jgi:hypothetical protein
MGKRRVRAEVFGLEQGRSIQPVYINTNIAKSGIINSLTASRREPFFSEKDQRVEEESKRGKKRRNRQT